MQTNTSAYANKMLKSLEEDKAFWLNKEEEACTYVAAINEEPVVPDYDYVEVATTIAALDDTDFPSFQVSDGNRETTSI